MYNCFPDAPGRTTAAIHDLDVGEAIPIKQHAYRVNPVKREYNIRKEVEYIYVEEWNRGTSMELPMCSSSVPSLMVAFDFLPIFEK